MGNIIKDNEFIPIAKAIIETAKKYIYISSFKIEATTRKRGRKIEEFWKLLKKKASEGVKIHFLINWNENKRSVAKTNYSVGKELQRHKIEVRHLKNNRCNHAKFIIVDKNTALVGSHNLSIQSCSANFEISYLTKNDEAVKNLCSIFERSFLDGEKF